MDLALPTASSTGDLVALAVLIVAGVPVVVVDIRSRRIPDVVVMPAFALVCVSRTAPGGTGWAAVLAWALITSSFLLIPALIRPEGMGMGDVKLAALLGACLGALAPACVLLALITGAVGGGAYALARRVPLRQATIPLGPFLIASALALALPVALLHSRHVAVHAHHTPGSRAAVRPARVGVRGLGRDAAMGGAGAADRTVHRCRPGPGRGDPAA